MEKSMGHSNVDGNYAPVNGVNLYYELHGEHGGGTPLVMLHGGLGGITMLTPILPAFTRHRQVIGVDLQGHAHTADVDRPLRFESLADDVAALVERLGLRQVDLWGYSLGGGTALQMTIRHPQLVRKLVIVSTPVKRSGWYPDVLAGMDQMTAESAQMMVGAPMQVEYARTAPNPEDFPRLVGKTGDLLRQEYDWSTQVAGIQAPVLAVFGDADAVRATHAVEIYTLLGGGQHDAGWDGSGMPKSRLAILPGTTHYNSFISPLMATLVTQFLDEPMPGER